MNSIEKNIRSTIRKMRRKGTIGASIDCLRQNTPTNGVVIHGTNAAEAYKELFDLAAKKVAADMDFELCDDCWAAIQLD